MAWIMLTAYKAPVYYNLDNMVSFERHSLGTRIVLTTSSSTRDKLVPSEVFVEESVDRIVEMLADRGIEIAA